MCFASQQLTDWLELEILLLLMLSESQITGFVFNCSWDITLHMDSNCFGFLCMLGVEEWCVHCIIDD